MPTKADTSVKWFANTIPNSPTLSGVAGAMIGLLDACLINGFDPRTPDSIVVAAGVATVNISAGHPFEEHAVIVITGATPAGLNDEWRIDTITANSFTFICPGIADGTATGTISVKRAPAGWVKPFSDTNLAVYQSDDPTSTQLYLRVDDTGGQWATMRGYEDMTDVNTGTGGFPTTSGPLWMKSSTGLGATSWVVFADKSMVYFYNAALGVNQAWLSAFGDYVSFLASDSYNCIVTGTSGGSFPEGSSGLLRVAVTTNLTVARRADQITQSALFGHSEVIGTSTNRMVGDSRNGVPVGGLFFRTGLTVTDGGAFEGSPTRGHLPGIAEPSHRAFTTASPTIVEGQGLFAGRKLVGLGTSLRDPYGCFAVDVTGPWR